jgi:hypothetical protein
VEVTDLGDQPQGRQGTAKGALRSLKRHLARRFYKLLAEPPVSGSLAIPDGLHPHRHNHPISTAPNPMICVG